MTTSDTWTNSDNQGVALEVLAACVVAMVFLGGPGALQFVTDIMRFPSNVGSDVSPAWSAYVADRIAAGDIGCSDGPYYVRIGTVEGVWMNYPIAFGQSPNGGGLDRKTGEALHQAHLECISRRDEQFSESR